MFKVLKDAQKNLKRILIREVWTDVCWIATYLRWKPRVPPGWELPPSPLVSNKDPRMVAIYSGLCPLHLGFSSAPRPLDALSAHTRFVASCPPRRARGAAFLK